MPFSPYYHLEFTSTGLVRVRGREVGTYKPGPIVLGKPDPKGRFQISWKGIVVLFQTAIAKQLASWLRREGWACRA